MRLCSPLVVLLAVVLGASSDAKAEISADVTTVEARQLSSSRGGFIVMPDDMSPVVSFRSAAAPGDPLVIFMNKEGGVYTPGNNDSRTNRSFLPNETSSIAAWDTSDANWNEVMSCVRDQFSRFNVEVTDIDPGDAPHLESVVGGRSIDIGIDVGPDSVVLGVSPFTRDCGIIDNSIVFTFAESVQGGNPQVVCEIATQEIAHSFGLDHQYLCEDPMSYLSGCGAKTFQNVESSCGEFEARSCAVEGQYDCGSDTQNSVELLTQRIGLAPDAIPPTAAIQSPASGTQVPRGFEVLVDASDDKGLVSATLLIDGVVVDESGTAPYKLLAPSDIALGMHDVEVIVTDYTNDVSETLSVEVISGASSSSTAVSGGCQTGSKGQNGPFGLLLALIAAVSTFSRRRI